MLSFMAVFSYPEEKKPSQNLALILQKQIFFGSTEIKNDLKKNPDFVSQIPSPQPLDRVYSLAGTFSYLDEPEKNTAVLTEISSKKIIFLKKDDIVSGNRVLAIDEKGVLFESGFGERFLFTQSGIKYSQVSVQRSYFKINIKNAMDWLKKQPEFLGSIKFVQSDGVGFVVNELEQGSIFEKAGLNNQDRVFQINDVFLKKPQDAMSALNEIFKGGKKMAVVKLTRFNKQIELVYILE